MGFGYFGVVEYSTGPKSAKYWPELVYLIHASFQKKWQPLGRGTLEMPQGFVLWFQLPKMDILRI